MMKKFGKWLWRFFLNKLILVLMLLAVIYLLYYSKGLGLGPAIETNVKVKEEKNKEAKILPMRFVKDVLEIGSWSSSQMTHKELKTIVEDIRKKYENQEVIVEYHRNQEDPFTHVQEVKKYLEENNLTFREIKKP